MEKEKKKKGSPIIKFIMGFFAVILIGLASYGIYWYVQTTTYVTIDSGKVSSNILSVMPKVSGKVVDVKVKDGDKVKAGDVLFVIDNQQLQIQLNQADAALDVAKTQLAKVVGGARAEEVSASQAMVDQSKASLSGAQVSKANLQSSLNDMTSNYNNLLKSMSGFKDSNGNYSSAAAIGSLDTQLANNTIKDAQYTLKVDAINQLFSAKAQLESSISQLKSQLKVADTQISALNAGVSAANSKLNLTNAGATSNDVKVLEDQVKIAQANYDLAKINFDNANVKATIDGLVAQINVLVGSTATQAAAAVSIMDTSKIQISGDVTEDKINKVKVGQTVKIKMDAVPGIVFTGKVSEIGLATASAINPMNTEISFSSSSTTVKLPIKIDFDNQGKDVKPGMSVNADIRIK